MRNFYRETENKYKIRLSKNKIVIVRFDGINVTKNKDINLLDTSDASFTSALHKTAKYLSIKYNCICYSGSDEINMIIEDTDHLEKIFKSLDTQKITSKIGQEMFLYFNTNYKGKETIFFDTRTFSIKKSKIESYIKYRKGCILNTMNQYFAKKNLPYKDRINLNKEKLEELLKETSIEFNKLDKYVIEGIKSDFRKL